MKVTPILRRIETFEWMSEDGKTQTSFEVTKMLDEIAAGRLKVDHVTTEINEAFITTWLLKRDLNKFHVASISRPRLDEPVLGVWMDDAILLIDGGHRYLARYAVGLRTVDYLLVAESDWRPFATETKLS